MSVIKHKNQRVGIFIDTQNLYHTAKNDPAGHWFAQFLRVIHHGEEIFHPPISADFQTNLGKILMLSL